MKVISMKDRAAARKQSPAKFAEANIHADSPEGKLARLYHVMMGAHGSGQATMEGMGDKRSLGKKLYQVG